MRRGQRGTDIDEEPASTSGEQAPAAKDEHAYEDSWYRSLKALAEARDTGPSDPEDDVEDEEAPTGP